MKKIAYMALHYGVEYLRGSMGSIRDAVDEVHIHYSPVPTCGYNVTARPPIAENATELLDEAELGLLTTRDSRHAPVLRWFVHPGGFPSYGAHCDAGVASALEAGADLIVNVDADEVWAPGALRAGFENVLALRGTEHHARRYRVPFVHFWRSFDWVCFDPAQPVRFIDPTGPAGVDGGVALPCPVLHFGYAQSVALVEYKWKIHGPLAELRSDCNWFEDKFKAWPPPNDVHPTCTGGFWNPQRTPADIRAAVAETLHDHPYRRREVIL